MGEVSIPSTTSMGAISGSKAKTGKDSGPKTAKTGLEVSFLQVLNQQAVGPGKAIVASGAGKGKTGVSGTVKSDLIEQSSSPPKRGQAVGAVGQGKIGFFDSPTPRVTGNFVSNVDQQVQLDSRKTASRSSAGNQPKSLNSAQLGSASIESNQSSKLRSVRSNSLVQSGRDGFSTAGLSKPTDRQLQSAGDAVVVQEGKDGTNRQAVRISDIQVANLSEKPPKKGGLNSLDYQTTPSLTTLSEPNRNPKTGAFQSSVGSVGKVVGSRSEKVTPVNYPELAQSASQTVSFSGVAAGKINGQTPSGEAIAIHNQLNGLDTNNLAEVISRPLVNGPGSYRVRVSLHPAELGQVDAVLTLDKSGLLVAITSQTQAGHYALNGSLDQLEQKLSSSGLKVSVTLQDSGANSGNHSGSQQGSKFGISPMQSSEVSGPVEGILKETGQIHIVL